MKMKNFYSTVVAVFLFLSGYTQYEAALNINHWESLFQSDGVMFINANGYQSSCTHSDWEDVNTMYSGNLWIKAIDEDEKLYVAGGYFIDTDFFEGPYRDTNNSRPYAIVAINKEEIDYHKDHYLDEGYEMPISIKKWPGVGRTHEGESTSLAPFIDVNENQCYDPENGDYPHIFGDQTVYIIYTDGVTPNSRTLSDSINLEIHTMIYGFMGEDNEDLANTMFVRHTVINRSQNNYKLKVGVWTDFDLGGRSDDLMGCDTSRNAYYTYNGTNFDEDYGIYSGFGENPPTIGVKFLNYSMQSFITHDLDNGNLGPPENLEHYNNYMEGITKDGSPLKDHQENETKFMYAGDPILKTGWTGLEHSSPGDIMGIASTEEINITPNGKMHLDIAYTLGYKEGHDYLQNIDNLRLRMDSVQKIYDNLEFEKGDFAYNTDCVAGIAETQNAATTTLFPNPNIGTFELLSSSKMESVSVISIDGKSIHEQRVNEYQIQLELPEETTPGLYLIQIQFSNGQIQQKKVMVESKE